MYDFPYKNVVMCALGKIPADLVIKNANVINVFTEEIIECDVAIKDGYVCRIGKTNDIIGGSTKIVNAHGYYLAPAFIDAHIHIESSMITLTEFAKAVIPHGTGTIITDIHELANVLGVYAIDIILEEAKNIPLNVFIMLPSCVPALENKETSGAKITAQDLEKYIKGERVLGLGEMMNYPGVLNLDEEVMKKIQLSQKENKVVDGHAPLLLGKELQAYISVGIHSDHESTTSEEVLEKLRYGMFVMFREGSVSKSLHLIKTILERRLSLERCIIVTDDRHPDDLINEGHLEPALRKVIEFGVDPIKAIKMVTIIPALAFRIPKIGAVAPGYKADVVLLDNLDKMNIKKVFLGGRLVASDGKLVVDIPKPKYPSRVLRTINVKCIPTSDDLLIKVPFKAEEVFINVIVARDVSLITERAKEKVHVRNGVVLPIPERDILQIVVVERHKKTGNIGKGFISGFGLKTGALASSIAHDSHNIVAVGANLKDLQIAIKRVIEIHGGIVVVANGKIEAELSLPFAGLMSLESVEVVASKLELVREKAKELGCKLTRPFMTLSFMALPVIPKLKITDKGLFDVEKFQFISVVEPIDS